jgi:hypothetical protein
MTDNDIRAVFERRAARADEQDLRESILRVTVSSPRRARWGTRVRPMLDWRTVPRLLSLAIVGAALITLGVFAAGGIRPAPDATHAPSPTGRTPAPTDPRPSAGAATPTVTAAAARAVAAEFEQPFEFLLPPSLELSARSVRVFRFSAEEQGRESSRGIDVLWADDPVVHPCPPGGQSSRVSIRSEPAGLLDDLGTIAGFEIGPTEPATLDGFPALAAALALPPTRCENAKDIHVGPAGVGPNTFVPLGLPARLIVAEVAGATIIVHVWAAREADLADWLPVAMEFVDSIEFVADR